MARKQEGRWTNVSKSVYSLVLSDDVVAAVDRAAYGLGTSRSNLINQLLADYVSFITPEKRRKDIFDSLASVLDSFEPFQVQNRGSDSMDSFWSSRLILFCLVVSIIGGFNK